MITFCKRSAALGDAKGNKLGTLKFHYVGFRGCRHVTQQADTITTKLTTRLQHYFILFNQSKLNKKTDKFADMAIYSPQHWLMRSTELVLSGSLLFVHSPCSEFCVALHSPLSANISVNLPEDFLRSILLFFVCWICHVCYN